MALRSTKWAVVLLLMAGGILLGAPAWQIPAADVRLRLEGAIRYSHLVRVDLPEELRATTKDVRAMVPGRSGMVPLGARLLRLGGVPVAVEVAMPRGAAAARNSAGSDTAAPVEVYLLAKEVATPPAQDIPNRTPAILQYSARVLTTRPFTSDEAVRLLGAAPVTRRGRPAGGRYRTYFYWTWESAGIGQVSRPQKQADPGERKAAVMHWGTELLIDHPQQVALGTDQANVAWFLYVDGKPAGDWRNSRPVAPSFHMGPAVSLEPGFHSLEYVVVQNHGEPIPQVFWRELGSKAPVPLPTDLQHSGRLPQAVLVERREGGLGGFSFSRLNQLVRAHTSEQFIDASLAAPKVDGKELAAPQWEGTPGRLDVFLPYSVLPPVRVPFGDGSLRFPARHVCLAPTEFLVDARVAEGPSVLSAQHPFAGCVVLDSLEYLSPEAAKRLRLCWRQQDASGAVLRSDDMACNATKEGAETPFSILVAKEARRLELTVTLDGLPVARPRRLRVLRPADSMVDLHAMGESLYVGRERALLVCDPLGPLPAAASAARKGRPHLVILDDFWATAAGPDAVVRPEKALGEGFPYAVFRLGVPRGRAAGAAGDLRKFDLLPALHEQRADAVLFALGWEDLRVGDSPIELCRHLLFLVQSAQAHGLHPHLMALPSLPDVPADASREAALLVKELGLELGIPVVDAFSAERLGVFDSGPFSRYFAAADGAVTLPTPNDAGRQRLCEVVRQVFRP